MPSPRTYVVLTSLLLTLACSKGSVISTDPATAPAVGSGGSRESGSTGGGGNAPIITSIPLGTDASVQADAEMVKAKEECDGGADCTCPPFNLAFMGKPGKWGSVRNGDPPTALMDWLNSSSAGTARADNFSDRKTLTPEFLATYNVIVFGSLSEDSDTGPWWTFSADEIAAVRAWIENGGGAIFLSGYSSGNEQAPSNQLLAFTGISFNQDRVGDCIDWKICGCTHSNTLTDWVQSDPDIAKLSTGVTMVGFEGGHSIVAPADAHVAARAAGLPALVGKLVGQGRVVAFGDEWITYTSQWTGEGNPSATDPNCKGFLPQDAYQIAQFWYDMIRWSQPSARCFKVVNTPTKPVVIW